MHSRTSPTSSIRPIPVQMHTISTRTRSTARSSFVSLILSVPMRAAAVAAAAVAVTTETETETETRTGTSTFLLRRERALRGVFEFGGSILFIFERSTTEFLFLFSILFFWGFRGRFLKPVCADDVMFGNTFDRPLKLPWGSGAALKFMQ